MSEKDDGGPAFPLAASAQTVPGGIAYTIQQNGMSLRDWFASQASQSDISLQLRMWSVEDIPSNRVKARYAFAAAMLAERIK